MAPSSQRENDGASSSMVAVADVPAISAGYLALSAGEILKVEYRGSESSGDNGWWFGCSAASSQRGWFAEASVRQHCQTGEPPRLVGSEAQVSTAVVPVGPGYLALVLGESVKIEYIGQESTGDAGWMFGQAVATGQKGWFAAAAISGCRDSAASTPKSNTAVDDTKFEPPVRSSNSVACAEAKMTTDAVSSANRKEPPGAADVATPLRRHVAASSSLGQAAASAEECGLTLIGTRALQDLPWQYPLCDKERGCFVGHLPGAVDARKAKKLMDVVQNGMEPVGWELPIKQMNGKVWRVFPRQCQWLVAPGCRCTYSYGGPTVGMGGDVPITVKPKDFPPWMQDVMQLVMPLCGLDDPKDWPNSCSMNRYSREATCDWHADDDEIFKATARNTSIICLSLGSNRTFELRRAGEMNTSFKFDVKGGDLYTMEGMTQKHYQHFLNQLPGPRVSLTWRWIVYHRCGRR